MNIYTFKSLGMLGQMYVGGEEVNDVNGCEFYRVDDVARERAEYSSKLGERDQEITDARRVFTERWDKLVSERNGLSSRLDSAVRLLRASDGTPGYRAEVNEFLRGVVEKPEPEPGWDANGSPVP